MLALARCFTWNIRRLPVAVGRPTRTPLAHLREGLGPRTRRINEVKSLGSMGHRDVAPFDENRRRASAPVNGCAGWSPIAQWSASPNCPPDLFHVKHVAVEQVGRAGNGRPALAHQKRAGPDTAAPAEPSASCCPRNQSPVMAQQGSPRCACSRSASPGPPTADRRTSINACPHGTLGRTIRSATDDACAPRWDGSDRGGHHTSRRRPAHGSRFASRPSGPSPSENLLNQRVDRPGRHPASAGLTALVDAPDHLARRRLSAPNTPHRAGFRGGSLCAAGFLASASLPRAAFEYRAPILRGAASALLARRGPSSSRLRRLRSRDILWRRTPGVLRETRARRRSSVCRVGHARLKVAPFVTVTNDYTSANGSVATYPDGLAGWTRPSRSGRRVSGHRWELTVRPRSRRVRRPRS